MTDFEGLKKQYQALEAMCSALNVAEAPVDQFRARMIIYVLRVWSAQPGFHEDYIPALAIMMEGVTMTEEELQNFMSQVAAKPVISMMPAFVLLAAAEEMLAEHGLLSVCRSFVDQLVTFLTDMAFINGDCTPEEANEIEHIRMVHMDFYNEYTLTRRRVASGALPPGDFCYERYGAKVEYTLRADGSVVLNSDESGTLPEPESVKVPESKYMAESRLPDELIQVDRRVAEIVGITDCNFHAWWCDGSLLICGKIYAAQGLKKQFSLTATVYDRDGDIVESDTNGGYGSGGITCSTVRKSNFFQGYPVRFDFFHPLEQKEDVSKIKITFNHD